MSGEAGFKAMNQLVPEATKLIEESVNEVKGLKQEALSNLTKNTDTIVGLLGDQYVTFISDFSEYHRAIDALENEKINIWTIISDTKGLNPEYFICAIGRDIKLRDEGSVTQPHCKCPFPAT